MAIATTLKTTQRPIFALISKFGLPLVISVYFLWVYLPKQQELTEQRIQNIIHLYDQRIQDIMRHDAEQDQRFLQATKQCFREEA